MRNPIAIFLLLATFTMSAAEPQLKLNAPLYHGVAGLPLPISLAITTADPVALPGFNGYCDGHTSLRITKADGQTADWTSLYPCTPVELCFAKEAEQNKQASYGSSPTEIILVPGSYKIQATYISKGPFNTCSAEPIKLWEGSIASSEATIIVTEQNGKDKIILEELGVNTRQNVTAKQYLDAYNKLFLDGSYARFIIMKYPDSFYAAYLFAGPALTLSINQKYKFEKLKTHTPKEHLETLRKEKYPSAECRCNEKGKVTKDKTGNCPRYSQEDIQRNNIAIGESILKDHPDFPYLENAKFKLAKAYLMLREDDKAMPLLKDLSITATNAERLFFAKAYLEASQEH